VLLNQDIWDTSTWRSFGVGIFGGYAVMWFGELTDPDGAPGLCGVTSVADAVAVPAWSFGPTLRQAACG